MPRTRKRMDLRPTYRCVVLHKQNVCVNNTKDGWYATVINLTGKVVFQSPIHYRRMSAIDAAATYCKSQHVKMVVA